MTAAGASRAFHPSGIARTCTQTVIESRTFIAGTIYSWVIKSKHCNDYGVSTADMNKPKWSCQHDILPYKPCRIWK